uniref:hypothetical protein n=1 Tax=Actinoplanes sp. CA-151224 TaxID=3239904 RepID=UPI003F4972B8
MPFTTSMTITFVAKPTPSATAHRSPHPTHPPAPAPAGHEHPVVAVLHFLFATAPGRVLLLAAVIGLLALFVKPFRRVVGPVWRAATGGLIFETPGPWDSTWLYAAPTRPQERPNFRGERYPRTRWGRVPGYQRMAVRWATVGYLWALVAHPLVTLWTTGLAVVVLVVHRVVRVVHDWGLHKVAGIFAAGAAPLLGYEGRDPARWIAVPRMRITMLPVAVAPRLLRATRRLPRVGDRLEHLLGALAVPVLRVPLDADDATVRIALDAEITSEAVIQSVENLAVARLPEGPWKPSHKQRDLVIELKHPKRPPAHVRYDAGANQAYPIDEVPIGMSATGWEVLPLKAKTPHGVVSASTGWGKTTFANVYVAHTAGNGGFVLLNDPKRIGFLRAFGDLPNVVIRSTLPGWIDNIERFHQEMNRRYTIIEQYPEIEDNPEAYFQPWFLVTDEKGSFTSEIKAWWKDKGEKGLPEPLRLEKINLWQGRAAAMYLLDLAQQANLDVFLDSDGRDQRMARIAAGPQTRSSWMMLFPGIAKVKTLTKKGRAILGIGPDDVKEVQLAQVSIEDARAFAEAGAAIGEMENIERQKRLSALMGPSVPSGTSEALSGQTPPTVPGQYRPGHFNELSWENAAESDFPINIPRPGNGSKDTSDRPVSGVRDDTENSGHGEAEKVIVGIQAAADLLGMKPANFEKARQRRPIDGETRRGTLPAWKALDLQEWRSQAPRAGRPAAAED